MMRRPTVTLAVALACCVSVGCPRNPPDPLDPENGVVLDESPIPPKGELERSIKVEEIPYLDDNSYLSDPSLLLGKVAAIRKRDNTCSPEAPEGRTAFEEKITSLAATNPTTPVLLRSVVVNKSLTASVSLLSYLSGSLTTEDVATVLVTDERNQRVNDNDPSYATQRTAFLKSSPLVADTDICWLLQVDGYTHKSIASKVFRKVSANGTGGAFGIKVGGSYYSSSEEYSLTHRFGLSFTVLKRPSRTQRDTVSIMASALTDSAERKMIASLVHIPDKTR